MPMPTIYRYVFTVIVLLFFASSSHSQGIQSDTLDIKFVVETTLSKNVNIKLKEQDVLNARGTYLNDYGSFDPTFNASLGYNQVYTPEYVDDVLLNPLIGTSTYSLGLTKPFIWGGNLSLLLQMTRTVDTLDYHLPPNLATVGLQFELPLLQGLGEDGTGGDVLTDEYNLKAEGKQYVFTISEQILNSVQSYWNYLGAKRSLEIIEKSLAEAQEFYEENQTLSQNDNIPGSDLTALLATISQKKIDLLNAKQTLYSARQTLGLNMGLDFENIDQLPPPKSRFLFEELLILDSAFIVSLPINSIVEIALNNRQDYMANLDQVTANEYQVKKAENGTLSELDLTLSAGYTGITEGKKFDEYFNPFYKNVEGLNFGATLSYTLPFGNNNAEGTLLTSKAQYLQSKINAVEKKRQIRSSVTVQLKQFQTYYLSFLESERIVAYNLKALADEKMKMKMGTSNSINVDYIERNLLAAQLANIQAMQNLANSIVRIRYETGTIVNSKGEVNYVNINNLLSFR